MKYIISIIILLLIPITFALTETSEIFNENQEYIADGRTIKVQNIFEEGIIISVDDSASEILRFNETIKIKQVNLTINDIVVTPEEKYVDLEIKIINKFECKLDFECNDGDISTKDSCNISKNICKYEEITQCIDNDGYCPSNCFENSDNDCKLFCEKDDDCDDKNPCTIDSCNGDNLNRGKCEYINKTACDSSDDCCPDGCKKTSEILSGFTNGYSLHHKHIAKKCNVGKVIRYKGNNMKVVRFFINNIKKYIVVWAKDMNAPHGKAIKLDNDQIRTKSKRSYQYKQKS